VPDVPVALDPEVPVAPAACAAATVLLDCDARPCWNEDTRFENKEVDTPTGSCPMLEVPLAAEETLAPRELLCRPWPWTFSSAEARAEEMAFVLMADS
jgi:hypothetical protein